VIKYFSLQITKLVSFLAFNKFSNVQLFKKSKKKMCTDLFAFLNFIFQSSPGSSPHNTSSTVGLLFEFLNSLMPLLGA
jgi:hypothetical protein